MVMSHDAARDVAQMMMAEHGRDRDRLDRLDRYLRGRADNGPSTRDGHDLPYMPAEAGAEYRLLARRAETNWLPLVVSSVTQALYVEGYRAGEGTENAPAWQWWQANALDRHQTQVHRASLGYGVSWVTVLPGVPGPVIRGRSPRKMSAMYADPVSDDWPIYAVQVDPQRTPSGDKLSITILDDEAVYWLSSEPSSDRLTSISHEVHGLGVCPVVRFPDLLDLDGRYQGEVEQLIPIQDRLNQTTFDLLMTQTFSSFKVRTVAGMTSSEDASDEEVKRRNLQLAQDRFLTAEDHETKFGQLDESPLDGFISSIDQATRNMAAISQTPPHHLLGQMANLSAEALAAAESSLMRKVDERKHIFGESWEQVLRLASAVAGDVTGAGDMAAEVVWADTEARSLAATADALTKLANPEGLNVPRRALWSRIPGVSQTEADRWAKMAKEEDPVAELRAMIDRQTGDDGEL